MRISFRTAMKRCPDCNKTLKTYRTEIRHIISLEHGIFTAAHLIRRCGKCMNLFRSKALDIMGTIHDESVEVLRNALSSYILQIDGTVDADFAMTVVVSIAVNFFPITPVEYFPPIFRFSSIFISPRS